MTAVKDQGFGCRACWAFAAVRKHNYDSINQFAQVQVGALEGANRRAFGSLRALSEQHLIDCSVGYGQLWGCQGGFIMDAMNFVDDVRREDGQAWALEDMQAYPYTGQVGFGFD